MTLKDSKQFENLINLSVSFVCSLSSFHVGLFAVGFFRHYSYLHLLEETIDLDKT